MAITILAPRPSQPVHPKKAFRSTRISLPSSNEPRANLSDEDDGPPNKKRKSHHVLTPGETITTDTQWMRGHGTTIPIDSSTATPPMLSTVAGTLNITNKLLSVTPLHARYQPSIGDLVVGRITNVSAAGKRWNVDIAAPLLASLPLSAINLPGGVLRRRTAVDELNVRSFFAEGDLVVAEVQEVRNDGSASLHTRSIRYGKLRNGIFLAVRSAGADAREGGVVRSRKQITTLDTRNGGSKVDVILGVNGYVFVCAHMDMGDDDERKGSGFGASNFIDEEVSRKMYASANEPVSSNTRKEIARLACVVKILAERGVRVDEKSLRMGYNFTCDAEFEAMDVDAGRSGGMLDGEAAEQLVQTVLAEMEVSKE